jgi:1,4-alpha-glucan branching enzyme
MPLIPVRFELTDFTAASVSVAGTFNQWKPESTLLHTSGAGLWHTNTALPPGNYEYRFVVDGQWINDPMAKNSQPNPHGGSNSVLTVTTPEEDHLADAENIPFTNQNDQTTQ